MIPSDLAASLRLLTESSVNPVSAIRGLAAGLPELDIGQRFIARIESQLPDGSYRAQVAGRSLTLALPQAAHAGEQLELLVVARTPRLIVAEQAGALQLSSAPTTFSRAGQFLGALLADAAAPVQAGNIPGTQPLAASPTTQAALLAPALRQAIAESGLFYEAHQAHWLAGRYPAAALAREPQARFSRPPPAAGNPAAIDPQNTARTEVLLPGREPPAAETSARAAAASTLPVELQALVHEQLNTASTGQVVWRGEIWPGLPLEWEISEEEARPSGSGDEDEATAPVWRTTLRLTLPQLGEVHVALALDPAKVSAGITAPGPSLAPLRAGLADLVAAFQNAGLPPLSAGVSAETLPEHRP